VYSLLIIGSPATRQHSAERRRRAIQEVVVRLDELIQALTDKANKLSAEGRA